MSKIMQLVKKSIKSHTLAQDIFCYLLKKTKFASNYTAGLISMDRTYYKLEKKYRHFIDKYEIRDKEHCESNYIWIFWFQGIENAPTLIKKCIESVKKNFKNKDIMIITMENYNNYVDIPDYVIEKFKKKIISITHFSDILRTELLIKYGGLWLDATTFCTGNNIEDFSDLDFFVYRNGWMDMENINMSNWLIYSKSYNEILELTLALIYEYWRKNNYIRNYFLYHMFFKMATEKYKEQWDKVPYLNHINNHLLVQELNKEFDSDRYNQIIKLTNFHKLSYKIEINNKDKNNFYNKIMGD